MSLIEKPAATAKIEAALHRVSVTDRPNGVVPVIAEASEEIPFLEATVLGPRLASGIRWALKDEDYQRAAAGLVCHQCLTPFPAPPTLRYIKTWRSIAQPEWNWGDAAMRDRGLALVAQGCCPICGYECSPEMLALQLEETPVRSTDPEWDEHVARFDERAEAYFDKVDRDKRSTGFKPRGGFLANRPIRSAFQQTKGD